MKVIDLAEFFSERGGGVRAYLTQLLREGAERGHAVTVVAPGPRDEAQTDGLAKLIRLAGPPMPYDPSYHALTQWKTARALVRRERPDVLQASSPWIAAPLAASIPDIPLRVLVLHSDPVGTYARPVLSRSLGDRGAVAALALPYRALAAVASRFDATVVSGRWLGDRLTAAGIPRVRVVPFGVDRRGLGSENADRATRRELMGALAERPGASLVVIAGRLAVEKRVGYALDVISELQRSRPVAVAVVGDGPERARLEARAEALGLCATFTGFVRDRARYARILASADVLLHACAVETFGFTVAEALASGVAVVTPDEGGAAEFVRPGAGERFTAYGPAVDAAVAVDRLLDQPPAVRTEAALAASREVPDAARHFDDLFALYASMLAERGAA